MDKIKGMNITLTTTARNDEEGRELLKSPRVSPACSRRSAINGPYRKNREVAKETEIQGSCVRNRSLICGRARAYIRKFKMCRICFRGMAPQRRNSRRNESELVSQPG